MPPLVRVAKMNHDVEHGSTVLSSRIGESCAASVEFMSENVDEVEKAGERADTMTNRGTTGLNLKIAANAVRSAQEPQGICLSTITVHSLHSRKHFPIQKGRGSSDDDGAKSSILNISRNRSPIGWLITTRCDTLRLIRVLAVRTHLL